MSKISVHKNIYGRKNKHSPRQISNRTSAGADVIVEFLYLVFILGLWFMYILGLCHHCKQGFTASMTLIHDSNLTVYRHYMVVTYVAPVKRKRVV